MKRWLALVKIHPFITMFVVLIATGASLTIAQIGGPPAPAPANFFPDGALVYAEARDLEGLLEWWRDSEVRSSWQESANYEQFQNSRLYLKLKDRMKKWGEGGKFAFDLDNLVQASGDRSAVAIYDIGELKALAATRLPWEEAKVTELWLAKGRFQEKTVSNRKYYAEPRDGALSFAYVEPYLLASTEEALLIRALQNFGEPVRSLAQSVTWNSVQQMDLQDVSIFLDQEKLQQNRYFQKYWIHRNVKDFTGIQAIRIDLTLEDKTIVEHRRIGTAARGTAGGSPASDSGTAGGSPASFLKEFQQHRDEFLSFDAPVDATRTAQHILSMVNRLPAKDERTSYPPTFSGAAERASQAETKNILLEQIDETVLQVKSESFLAANQEEELAKILKSADPGAEIRLAYPLWDNQALFVRFPQTLILQMNNFRAFDQQSFLHQLLQHFLLLNATQDAGGRWQSQGNGSYSLQSFRPLYVQFREPWVVIATEESDFRAVTSHLPAPSAIPHGSYRYANWKQGRWKYARLMQRLDHGALNDEAPLLFSENIASLLATLDPIVASSVTKSDGKEMIRYELE